VSNKGVEIGILPIKKILGGRGYAILWKSKPVQDQLKVDFMLTILEEETNFKVIPKR